MLMFRSYKMPDRRVTLFSLVCLVIFVLVCFCVLRGSAADTVRADGRDIPLAASGEEDVLGFLSALGYDAEVLATQDITVPESWNEVYSSYAVMQQEQGLSLERCKGMPAVLYVCAVEGERGIADILVCDGRIAAADMTEDGAARPLFKTGDPS